MTKCGRDANALALLRDTGPLWKLALAGGTLKGLLEHSLCSRQSKKLPPTFSPLLPRLGSDLHFDLTDLSDFLTSSSFFFFFLPGISLIKFRHVSFHLGLCFLEMPRLTQVNRGGPLDKPVHHQSHQYCALDCSPPCCGLSCVFPTIPLLKF